MAKTNPCKQLFDRVSRLCHLLDGFLEYAKSSRREVPSSVAMRLLSPANPIVEELRTIVKTLRSEDSQTGEAFDEQESDFSRAVWMLRTALIDYFGDLNYPTAAGWGDLCGVVVGQFAPSYIESMLMRFRAIENTLSSVTSDAANAENPWKQAREQNAKITINDQMLLLFRDDDSIVDRKGLSKAVASILGCSEQAVRHPDNTAWQFYRTEQARRKKIRQDVKGKRWVESEQNDDND